MKLRNLVALGVLTAVLGTAAMAAEYTPGVTVAEDADSATGYTVTFVYDGTGMGLGQESRECGPYTVDYTRANADAKQVQLRGAFTFYPIAEVEPTGATPAESFTPYEWQNGMFEAGDESLTLDMENVEGNLWTVSMPLPSGHYQYVFLVDGDSKTKLEDPTNPMEASGVENGMHYDRSTFYVPYDAEKQSESIDFSYMAPIEEAGTVAYYNYTDVNGNAAPLGVYLPYGYSEDAEPYKVVYVSHGGGGNETDWFAGGSLDYIFDNMIAEGTTEPVVLVCMNNTLFGWNFDTIVANLKDCVIPYVEANFNVSTEVADRAFTGLSMGGMTTTHVMCDVPELFGYFGIQSGCDAGYAAEADVDWEAVKAAKILLAAGCYDFGLVGNGNFPLSSLTPVLDEKGVEYGWYEAYGSHDWMTWPQIIKVFAEEYLWK